MANEKRLIDANEVIKETESILNFRRQHHMPTVEYEALLEYLKKRPTVDAEPVVHGEWVEDYETFVDDSGVESFPIQTGYVCSECGVDGSAFWRYCPYCGAKMDGGNDDAV